MGLLMKFSKIWDYFKIIDDVVLLIDEVDDTLKKNV
jgi:hypothetical protein